MDYLALYIGIICLLFIWWNLWISMRIVLYLRDHDHDASLFKGPIFIKGRIFRYLPVYKQISKEEEGRTGSLYRWFYISFVGMSLFFLAGLFVVMS